MSLNKPFMHNQTRPKNNRIVSMRLSNAHPLNNTFHHPTSLKQISMSRPMGMNATTFAISHVHCADVGDAVRGVPPSLYSPSQHFALVNSTPFLRCARNDKRHCAQNDRLLHDIRNPVQLILDIFQTRDLLSFVSSRFSRLVLSELNSSIVARLTSPSLKYLS